MDDSILQLYPQPATERKLEGLYLSHNLRQHYQTSGHAFVYANFITSVDGRIAIPHPTRDGLMVPNHTANERDWRLFQELAAQADIIISSGRYLRDWAEGRAQEILQTDDPRFADLRAWRNSQGLAPQPDIAIISSSLKFPIPDVLKASGRKVVVFTTANPDPVRVAEIESQVGKVIIAGDELVDGELLVQNLTALGYQAVYSAAGPKILHLLLSSGVLDRLYLTVASRLLGGQPFASILTGPLLEPVVDLQIRTLYFDPHALNNLGQLLISYNKSS
jgi:riboflavin biosynthesis pyrimidine reductase